MKKELTITISGQARTGKSTMVLLLEKFLKEQGFDAEIEMSDELFDYGSEFRFRRIIGERLKEIDAMKSGLKITLKQVQTSRNGSEEECQL